MNKVRFGKTELMVSPVAFGGIPIMRIEAAEAEKLVREAIDLGVNFIDTAHGYGDSEEKIGRAIKDVPREQLVIASKAPAADRQGFHEQLDTSLKRLGVDYIDIFQHHGVSSQEKMQQVLGPGGAFEGMLEALDKGKIRHTAFSSHSLPVAKDMMLTGKYEVTQIPFNFVDDAASEEIIPLANKLDMGFICMKPLGGGLLDNAEICFRYLIQFDNIIPDPGIEKLEEIKEIVGIYERQSPITADDKAAIEELRAELGNSWCHRCDYCQPCPQKIPISTVLVAKSTVKRMPLERASSIVDSAMDKTAGCTECRECVDRCPYDLEIPELLKAQRESWNGFLKTGVWN